MKNTKKKTAKPSTSVDKKYEKMTEKEKERFLLSTIPAYC